jgi:uncharacterized coiled-coil protein SlyX
MNDYVGHNVQFNLGLVKEFGPGGEYYPFTSTEPSLPLSTVSTGIQALPNEERIYYQRKIEDLERRVYDLEAQATSYYDNMESLASEVLNDRTALNIAIETQNELLEKLQKLEKSKLTVNFQN